MKLSLEKVKRTVTDLQSLTAKAKGRAPLLAALTSKMRSVARAWHRDERLLQTHILIGQEVQLLGSDWTRAT